MREPLVLTSVHHGVATVLLNRPERLNSMTAGLLEETLTAVETLAHDRRVRVVVLSGAGRGFCAGGDLAAGLEEINGPPPLTSQAGRLRRYMRISQLLHYMPQVTIAAVNGPCAGAGLSLALACDLRFAAAGARFNTAFLGAGVTGDFGGTWLATRCLGGATARRLFLLSERLDADEALRLGLVSHVVPDEGFLAAVQGVAAELASRAPLALLGMKANLNDAEWQDFPRHLDVEATRHAASAATADAAEAAAAFGEKRTPQFTGS
jgi:2-(1,2-epoxy-1,2-dihydrophenyl)acetyl-CoA isomerase